MFCGNCIEISDCGVFLVGFLKKKNFLLRDRSFFMREGGGWWDLGSTI